MHTWRIHEMFTLWLYCMSLGTSRSTRDHGSTGSEGPIRPSWLTWCQRSARCSRYPGTMAERLPYNMPYFMQWWNKQIDSCAERKHYRHDIWQLRFKRRFLGKLHRFSFSHFSPKGYRWWSGSSGNAWKRGSKGQSGLWLSGGDIQNILKAHPFTSTQV